MEKPLHYVVSNWDIIVPVLLLIGSEAIAINKKWQSNSWLQLFVAVLSKSSKKK